MIYPAGTGPWVSYPQFPGATYNVVGHGDSMSLTSACQRTYLPRVVALMAAAGKIASWRRCGINGASWAYAWPSAGYPLTLAQDALVRADPAKGRGVNWLLVMAGTNGIILGGHSAATEYADFQIYIAARIAAGWPVANIVVCTMLPRTGDVDATRLAYNTSLIGGAATYGYKLARLDLDPNIGPDGADTNLTYFSDGTHPTDAGHAIIASIIYALMP